MTNETLKVLLVEDKRDDYILIRGLLEEIESLRFELTWAATYEDALRAISACCPDVCLIDDCLGGRSGVELLHEAQVRGNQLPVILLTSQDHHGRDLKAMKSGAADYLIKGQLNRPEESLTMSLLQTVAPEYVERARQMIARKLVGEEETVDELEIVAKDGHRIAVEVSSDDSGGLRL